MTVADSIQRETLSLSGVWQWATENITGSHLTITLAGLALIVATWTGLMNRRSAAAASAQATSARIQAEAATSQADEASAAVWEARRSSDAAELMTVDSVRARIDNQSPKIAVVIEEIPWPPTLVDWMTGNYTNETPIPIPAVFKMKHDFHMKLAFAVRGVVYNDGTQSVRVRPDCGDFVEGKTPLWPEQLRRPVKCHPRKREYWLLPGQAALFEWEPYHILSEWCKIHENESKARPLELQFYVHPGSLDGNISGTILRLTADPLQLVNEGLGHWQLASSPEAADVWIDIRVHRKYPKDYRSLQENPNTVTMDEEFYGLFGLEADIDDR